LRSFQRRLPDLEAHGLRIIAISADPPEINSQHCQKLGIAFPVLTDPQTEVIRRYGLLHAGGGPKGADISRPAEFLIDHTGTIRWVNLTESVIARARPEQVLKRL